jgi:hypothetical protein
MPTFRKFKSNVVPPAGEQSEKKSTLFRRGSAMHLRYFAAACMAAAISGIDVGDATAQDVVKIGGVNV